MTTTIKAAITTRAIRGKETYEAEYDGIKQINLYQIQNMNNGKQEIRTYLTSTTVTPTTIIGWGGLAEKMDELIDHHISPLLKELKT